MKERSLPCLLKVLIPLIYSCFSNRLDKRLHTQTNQKFNWWIVQEDKKLGGFVKTLKLSIFLIC